MFSREVLNFDPEKEAKRIEEFIAQNVFQVFKRRGGVVGVSGGIDSSVTFALACRALGKERVVAISMPEQDSSHDSQPLAEELVRRFGATFHVENITPALKGFGVYEKRDEAVRRVFPEYRPEWKMKITLPTDVLESDRLNIFHLTVIDPQGQEYTRRLPLDSYLQIVAASNIKQRSRMTTLYYQAESRNYAVIGTPNINEDNQGFYVKYGDGGVDIRPIAHLYKTQVFELGRYLGVPESILTRTPTTDTYSAEVTQEEFYFRLPFQEMDLLLYARLNEIPLDDVCRVMDLKPEQVQRVYRDFEQKMKMNTYLGCVPLVLTDSPVS